MQTTDQMLDAATSGETTARSMRLLVTGGTGVVGRTLRP